MATYTISMTGAEVDEILSRADSFLDQDVKASASPDFAGLVLTSPNGTRYSVTVDDSGTLVTTAA